MTGLGAGAVMSLMTCGDACVCGCCGGSGLAGTVVSMCTASMRSVLGTEPLEVTGMT